MLFTPRETEMAFAIPREVGRPRGRNPPPRGSSPGDVDEVDADSLDLITAKRLFVSPKTRYEFGKPFGHAVRACVNQHFASEMSGDAVDVDRGHSCFLQNAVASVVSPLQLQMKKYLWPGQCDGVWNEAPKNDHTHESVDDLKRSTDVNTLAVAEPLTPHISLQHKNQPINNQLPSRRTIACLSRAGNSNQGDSKIRFGVQDTNQRINTLKIRVNLPCRTSAHMSSGTRSAGPSPQGPAMWPNDAEVTRGRGRHTPLEPVEKRGGLPITSPSDQSRENLGRAYHSATETTESEHASVANPLEQPPVIADHLVLSRITQIMLRVFLRNFDAWRGRPVGSTSGTTSSSATKGLSSVSSRKRARGQPHRRNLADDDGEDNLEDNGDVEDAGSRKRSQPDPPNLTLACPFFKKDRRAHGSCCGKKLTRIRDVKQHLKRRHYMPIYCPVCNLTFTDEMARDNHTIERICQMGEFPRPEGINARQQSELGRRASRQLSEEAQWYAIFQILFPDHPLPASAYIDISLLDSANAYQDFVATRGPDILLRSLESGGALKWNIPRGLDPEAFQRQMLSRGLDAISEAWSREGAPATTGRSGTRPAIGSGSESVDMLSSESILFSEDTESLRSSERFWAQLPTIRVSDVNIDQGFHADEPLHEPGNFPNI